MEENLRCFIAIDLPREVIKEISGIQKTLKNRNLFTGKFTEPENLHLTLKFLGEIDEEKIKQVNERLSNIKFEKFDAGVGEVGVFNKNYVKIIWIKLNGKGIYELQKIIDENLEGIFIKEKRFMGHITIARVKHLSNKKELLEYLDSIKPSKIKFNVDKFFLKKSLLKPEGPIYSDLFTFDLI